MAGTPLILSSHMTFIENQTRIFGWQANILTTIFVQLTLQAFDIKVGPHVLEVHSHRSECRDPLNFYHPTLGLSVVTRTFHG